MIFTFYRKLRDRIAYRLLIYILLFSGFVTLFITATQLYMEYRRDIDAINGQFNRIETIFKKPLIEALWFFNEKSIRLQLEGISNLRDIESLELTGEGETSIIVGQKVSKYTVKRELPLVYTTSNINREIGQLTIVASMAGVYARLYDRLIAILITQGIKTFLVSTFIFLIFHFLVVRHISSIDIYLKKCSFTTKPRKLKLKRKSTTLVDELDQTVSSINEMSGNLYKSYETINADLLRRKETEKKLQKARDELEQQVAQRTRSFKEERDRAQNYLDVAGVIMLTIDKNETVTLINRKGCEVFGLKEGEIIGLNWFETFVPPSERAKTLNVFKELIAGKGTETEYYEGKILNRSGEERIIAWHNTVLRDSKGDVLGTLSSGEDVTERKRAEEEKKKLAAQLLQSSKMESIAILSGGIAHDYNNLMSIVMGNLSMAQEEAEPGSDLADFLNGANMASRKVRDLTHELMSLSRGGAPVKELGSIDESLKTALDIMPADSGISLNESVSQDLWQVPRDPYKIGAVFRNVVTNAVEAMPEGGTLTITAENLRIEDKEQYPGLPLNPSNYVQISFQDQGVGIQQEHLDKIFDPYFSTKEMGVQKGMGLGLATAYAIVKSHGGHIQIDSSPGAGTTVNIYLPAESQTVEIDLETSSPDESALPMKWVLVMDDEEMLRKLARQMLERMGYSVETVKDGVEAIETYQKQKDSDTPFDAVILDLTIKGGMGGEQTIRELLKIDPDVKAIVSSGYFNDPVMSDFEKYGFMGALSKPYEKKALKEVLERLSE